MDRAAPVSEALAAYRDELIGFVARRAGHVVDPEDVVHRAAARALAAAGSLRDPARARAWLYRIVRNTLGDELRSLGLPAVEVPEDLADPAPVAPDPDRGRPCQCALDISRALRPDYRSILEQAVVEERAVVDIARDLGITANNAMVRLHRARKALRAAVVEHCGTTKMSACAACTC